MYLSVANVGNFYGAKIKYLLLALDLVLNKREKEKKNKMIVLVSPSQ